MLKSWLYILSFSVGILVVGCNSADPLPDVGVDPSTVVSIEVPEDGIQVDSGTELSKVFPVKNGPASKVTLDTGPDWLSARLIPISEDNPEGREVELSGTVPADAQGEYDVFLKISADGKHPGGVSFPIAVN